MSQPDRTRSATLAALLSLLCLSLFPSSLAGDYCSDSSSCSGEYCSCGTCYCHGNGHASCEDCGLSGGGIAGIVIGIIVLVAVVLCLLSLCYRHRYVQDYTGQTYATTVTAMPMSSIGGYPSPRPMQAIPVQYAQQYPQQPTPNQYGAATYTQTPVGAGQPVAASQPPAYTDYPTTAGGEGQPPITYPYKGEQYSGERAT